MYITVGTFFLDECLLSSLGLEPSQHNRQTSKKKTFCIHTVYFLTMGYRYARNM